MQAGSLNNHDSQMRQWLDGVHLNEVLHNYLVIYNKLHAEPIHADQSRAESTWWYVCGTGTARDPCLVLAPAFELKGTAHLMKATNRWEILVPPTSPDYLKVLPAPCIFHGATVEHEALQDAWARGRCSSMGEAWTIDSEIIRSLLHQTANLSFVSITAYPFDWPVMEDEIMPYGDYSTSLLRLMLDTPKREVYYIQIHHSLRLRRILDEVRDPQWNYKSFEPRSRHRR
ncbi:hypothetical protein BMF94_6702 [Rhodotorula taiwanensis]|uniref:Uncharacterized protein n=1 Tax=Rhodotorula taiwanensis TaxID=741276 RepID=A0A2S5B0J2_9BASI|nr:hypothetical protein BMF94_6702 [Rhodotorula taiwanensis]